MGGQKAAQWDWQAVDTGNARFDRCAIGPNSTDQAKKETKRNILSDAAAGSLAVVIAPANVHDT
jgi:hypothetical protein